MKNKIPKASIISLSLSIIILFTAIVIFATGKITQNRKVKTDNYTQKSNFEPISQKVLVIIYDTHEKHPDLPYIDPVYLTNQLEQQMEESSIFHEYLRDNKFKEVDIEIVDIITYEHNSPLITGQSGFGAADYNAIINKNNLCEKSNRNLIDEVWLWADRTAGYWESIMVGPSNMIFYINSLPMVRTDCKNPLIIMGFNYERTVDLAMHSFGHRIENTISHFLDGKIAGETKKGDNWYEYDGQGYPCRWIDNIWTCDKPDLQDYCGNVHFPPNTDKDYGYDDKNTRTFDCKNWTPQHKNEPITANCTLWGCSHLGYLKWWYQNMPGRCNGLSKLDGNPMPNWWWIIYKLDKAEPIWNCF